jgi:3-phenylpropionate/cinnamic acid dioxygenase small subunit
MSIKATRVAPELQIEIEQYYYQEAELLDDHRYGEWLELFPDDARYWMPTRANRLCANMTRRYPSKGIRAL